MNKRWGMAWAVIALPAWAMSLPEAIQHASTSDPSFQARAERVLANEAAVREARSGLFPQISLRAEREYRDRRLPSSTSAGTNASYNNAGSSEGWDQIDESELTIDQVLWNPVIGREIDRANADVALALASLEQARLDLIDSTIDEYLQVLKQAETVQLLVSEIDAVNQGLKLAWARFLDGTAREADALQAEGRVLAVVNQLRSAQIELATLTSGLSLRTGQPVEQVFSAPIEGQVVFESLVDWKAARLTNPELLVAQRQIDANESQVSVRRATYSPTIQLRLGERIEEGRRDILQSNGTIRSELDDVRDTTARIELRWDLFDGGRRKAQVEQAEVEVRAASIEYAAVENRFRSDVQLAQRRAELALGAQRSTRATLDAFQRVARERRAAYRAGLVSITDLIQAERELNAAQTEFMRAKYDAISAQVALGRLAGALDEEFLLELGGILVEPVGLAGLLDASR
ncbi:MAG: TolC family protein [Litorivicinus sp.]